jgi:hypothetical protein
MNYETGWAAYEFEDLKMKYDARFTIYEAELNHLLPTPSTAPGETAAWHVLKK